MNNIICKERLKDLEGSVGEPKMDKHRGWKSVFSYIGTTHNCSKYSYRSKNVLVPKWAKKRSVWPSLLQKRATAAKSWHHRHHTHEQSRGESATTDGHYQVVLSLLCLWPYGNSLIVSSHSEFYQCHTQNRSRYHATSEAGLQGRDRPAKRSFPNKAPDPC